MSVLFPITTLAPAPGPGPQQALVNYLLNKHTQLHCLDEEIEAQRGVGIFPGSHSEPVTRLGDTRGQAEPTLCRMSCAVTMGRCKKCWWEQNDHQDAKSLKAGSGRACFSAEFSVPRTQQVL